eukprot:1547223-Rhodomonas_salina.1
MMQTPGLILFEYLAYLYCPSTWPIWSYTARVPGLSGLILSQSLPIATTPKVQVKVEFAAFPANQISFFCVQDGDSISSAMQLTLGASVPLNPEVGPALLVPLTSAATDWYREAPERRAKDSALKLELDDEHWRSKVTWRSRNGHV